MARLLKGDQLWRRVDAIMGAGLLPEAYGQHMLDAIGLAVPSDGQRFFGLDPATLLLNRLIAASATDGPFRQRWLRDIYMHNPDVPYFSPHEVMRSSTNAVLYLDRQDHSLGIAPALAAQVTTSLHRQVFHDSLTPTGGSLRLCLRDGVRWVGMIDVVRRTVRRRFDPDEFAVLAQAAPLMGRGLGAALRREAALSNDAQTQPGGSGVVMLDANKHITMATPAGEAWLGRLWDHRPDGHAPLPTAAWAAVAALSANASFTPAVTARTGAGSVRIEASTGAVEGTIAIILSPVLPPQPPGVPVDWPLTRQERRIVELLIQGLGNRGLADKLCVTENTIETHLRHIYAKLEVRNRSDLLARLFQEIFLPAVEP